MLLSIGRCHRTESGAAGCADLDGRDVEVVAVGGAGVSHPVDVDAQWHDALEDRELTQGMSKYVVGDRLAQGNEGLAADRELRQPVVGRLKRRDQKRSDRDAGQSEGGYVAPFDLEVDVDVPEQHREAGVARHQPVARTREDALHLHSQEAQGLVLDRRADPELYLEVKDRLEQEQRVKPEVCLDPEFAPGSQEGRLCTELEGVGGDGRVTDDLHGDHAVDELEPDPLLGRKTGGQVREPRVESAYGENEGRLGTKTGSYDE